VEEDAVVDDKEVDVEMGFNKYMIKNENKNEIVW